MQQLQGVSTMTQKGQVVVPKMIRDYFNLESNDRIRIRVDRKKIILEPTASVDDVYGMVKGRRKKVLSKKQLKSTVRDAVEEKYSSK